MKNKSGDWFPSVRIQLANNSPAFTLIELTVVVATVMVLSLLLLPALAGTRYRDQLAMCTANCRQWGVGMITYASDHNNYFPNGPLPGTSAADPWDVANSFLPDMAAYGLNNPKTWFCPVRSWAYQQDNSITQAQLGHPLTTVTNDLGYLFAYVAKWPNPDFEGLAGGNNYGGQVVQPAGYQPWNQRPWLASNPSTLFPSIYLPNGAINPNRNSPYEWLKKTSDPHAAVMPISADIIVSIIKNVSTLNAQGLKAIQPGWGHPAGPSPMGSIQSDNLTFGDGHVETHQGNNIKWRYSAAFTSFY
jgi:type II secretory pathway pseudopilin PulG